MTQEGTPGPLPSLGEDLPAVRVGQAGPPQPTPRAEPPFFYGGQAVIEGVMMRGKRHYAVAVRLPATREIVVDRGELKASIYVNPIWKLPFRSEEHTSE